MRRLLPVLAWAAILLALLWGLGSHGLTEPDEGRTAGKAFEFYQTGTWLEPRLYGFGHMNKPPLAYWAGAVCMYAGGANEWTARMPAALAAFGTLVLTWQIGRRLCSREVAWASVAVLLTAPLFFAMSRIIDPNMVLTFWTTLSAWAAVAWFQEGRRPHLWVFYLALAGGFLTKGPVIWAIVGLGLAGYRWIGPRPATWRSLLSFPLALISVALSLSWFLLVAQRHPELYDLFLGRELVDRVASNAHGRREPFLFYFFMLPAAMLTWLPALLPALGRTWRDRRQDAMSRLALWWIALPFTMFTLSTSKMPTYVLPLLPLLAIAVGRTLIELSDRPVWRRTQAVWAILPGIILPLGLHLHGFLEYGWTRGLEPADALWLIPICAGVLIFRRKWWLQCVVVTVCGFLLSADLMGRHDHDIGSKTSTKDMAYAMKPLLREGDRVILFRNFPRGLNFYLQHPITISTKFELHLESDRTNLKHRWYDDVSGVGDVYRWFDHEPRVFVVTADRRRGGKGESALTPLEHLRRGCKRPVREIYRDSKYVVVCNFAPEDAR